jgi:hypothetical protein
MVVHLCFALTMSIRWRLLFPTLCWSINTKSILITAVSLKKASTLFGLQLWGMSHPAVPGGWASQCCQHCQIPRVRLASGLCYAPDGCKHKANVSWILERDLSSSSAHYNPLLDIGLSNCSPSRLIFGYSHPVPA